MCDFPLSSKARPTACQGVLDVPVDGRPEQNDAMPNSRARQSPSALFAAAFVVAGGLQSPKASGSVRRPNVSASDFDLNGPASVQPRSPCSSLR